MITKRTRIEADVKSFSRKANVQAIPCIRHADRIASKIYNIPLPSGENKRVAVCGACVPEFESWLSTKQLTRG